MKMDESIWLTLNGLKHANPKRVSSELIKLLNDETNDIEIRTSVVCVIGEIRLKEANPILIQILCDYSERIKLDWKKEQNGLALPPPHYAKFFKQVIVALRKNEASELVSHLLNIFLNGPADLIVFAQIFETLLTFPKSTLVQQLITLLCDENASVLGRRLAAEILGYFNAVETIPELIRLLNDENICNGIRSSIAATLGDLNAAEAIPDLEMFLNDKSDNDFVLKIRITLSKLNSFDLSTMLFDEKVEYLNKCQIISTLGKMNSIQAIPDLLKIAINDSDDSIKRVDSFVSFSNHSITRAYAINSLVELKALESIPENIIKLLNDEFQLGSLKLAVARAMVILRQKDGLKELFDFLFLKSIDYRKRKNLINQICGSQMLDQDDLLIIFQSFGFRGNYHDIEERILFCRVTYQIAKHGRIPFMTYLI